MAKFKGRIIFEVKFKDMHIPLFAMDNIVQKVALHKCAQQIEFWHKMEFHEKTTPKNQMAKLFLTNARSKYFSGMLQYYIDCSRRIRFQSRTTFPA